jgi:molybdate transport system substrate-binding protein
MRRLGIAVSLVCAVAAALAACRRPAPAPPPRLRIAAASDLRFALDELDAAFGRTVGTVDVSVSYGSSGSLFAQLSNGAPFDLFLSADIAYVRQLGARGLIVPGSAFTYALGRLVVWVPADSPIDVARLGMDALRAPGVMHVAIANPEYAPYGRAAEAAIRQTGLFDEVGPRLVLGENVAQAFQFAQSGSAQIAVIGLSLATAPSVAGSGRFWEVPPAFYPSIEQGGAVLRGAQYAELAQRFRTFLLSADGRAILERHGLSAPPA